jgi:hypothetical protein
MHIELLPVGRSMSWEMQGLSGHFVVSLIGAVRQSVTQVMQSNIYVNDN